MKPLTGVARIIARTLARCGGFLASVSGGNQRAMVGSTSASIPSFCATTMRSSHCWLDCGVDMQAESHTMMRSTRSGCCSARPSAVAPPAVSALQRRRLLVPHRDRGGERVGEDEPGRALRPVDHVVEIDAVRLDAHRFDPRLAGAV